jgi:hypothetical protein
MRSQTHLTMLLFACGTIGLPFRCSAQGLSVGVVAGAGLSSDFRSYYYPASANAPGYTDFSTPKRYLVGGMLEFHLPAHLSLEVDGIYRPIEYTFAGVEPNGTLNSISPSPVITWEFPVLAKYRFTLGPLKPFVEAGPSFRTAGNLNGTNPSHHGITAGIGIETHLWALDIAPTLRYTRWASDSQTTPDQLELMVAVSHRTENMWRPLGQRVSFGVVLGTNLTSYYPRQTITFTAFPGPTTITSSSSPGPQSFLVGPMIEAALAAGFSLEADAIYQPLHIAFTTISNGQRSSGTGSNIEWNFPVLGKYRHRMRLATPFAELGPAFRLPQGVTGASHYGVVAGLGAEVKLRQLKIAPEFRYTHWGPESQPAAEAGNLNRVEFLTGFSF